MRIGKDLSELLNTEALPNVWCPGCGHGNVTNALAQTLDRMDLDIEKVVMVGGIGCASRMPFYLQPSALHTTHGRALSFATGVKLGNPELTVIVVAGDGDSLAIGGNHLIQTCRRNIDITLIVLNNNNYGMTGGQLAPSTPDGFNSTTSMFGNIDPAFDTIKLVLAAGATFASRTTTFDFQEMPKQMEAAISHKGFSVVEVITQCPTYFGRMNKLGEPRDMLDYERNLTMEPSGTPDIEHLKGLLPTGIFQSEDRPEYAERYAELVARVQEGNNG